MASMGNSAKSVMEGKLKLFNHTTQEAIMITDGEMANYDSRLWQMVGDEQKAPSISREGRGAKRQKRKH